MYAQEFPHLARVTNNMQAELVRAVGANLTGYDVDVRIDYERWMEFEKEYGEWAAGQGISIGQDTVSPGSNRR